MNSVITYDPIRFVCCIWKELWNGLMDVYFLVIRYSINIQNTFKCHNKSSIARKKKTTENQRSLLLWLPLTPCTTISTEATLTLHIWNTYSKQWVLKHIFNEDKVTENIRQQTSQDYSHKKYPFMYTHKHAVSKTVLICH